MFRNYEKLQESGVKWLGQIPDHWSTCPSNWLFDLRNERARKEDKQLTASQKYGVIYQEDYQKLTGARVVQVITGSDILKRTEKGDFVISMRSFQGGLEYSHYSGAVSSAYVSLIPSKNVDPTFYTYLFKSRDYIQALQSTSNLVRDGQALRFSNFKEVRLPNIPLDEQKRIGAFLDKECSKIDSLIEKQQCLVKLLKEKKKVVISNAITRGVDPKVRLKDSGVKWIGKIPEHWKVMQLGWMTKKIGAGKTPLGGAAVYVEKEKGTLFLRSQNVYNYGLKLDQCVFIDEKARAQLEGATVRADDILLNVTGGSIGRNCRVPKSFPHANVNQHVCIIRVDNKIKLDFIEFYLKSLNVKEYIDMIQNGAAREGLNFEQISNMKVPLPPDEEIPEVRSFILASLSKFENLVDKAERMILLLNEKKISLISNAVTGKIEVIK